MTSIEIIKIVATLFSIAGSIILAYRVAGIIAALSLVADVHEVNIQQLMPGATVNIYNLGNSTAHIQSAKKLKLLIVGFSCLAISGLLNLVALVIAIA